MSPIIASAWWPPILQTALGGLIGTAGAIAGGAFGSWFTWLKERQSVAAAFAGEVRAIIDVIDWLQIVELIPHGYKFPVDDQPFPVFEAHIRNIGLLPADLSAKVVTYYTHARGIVQDFRTIYKDEIHPGTETKFRAHLAQNIETMLATGKALIPELQKEAKRTWRDSLQSAGTPSVVSSF
jgi:hypothetical protein